MYAASLKQFLAYMAARSSCLQCSLNANGGQYTAPRLRTKTGEPAVSIPDQLHGTLAECIRCENKLSFFCNTLSKKRVKFTITKRINLKTHASLWWSETNTTISWSISYYRCAMYPATGIMRTAPLPSAAVSFYCLFRLFPLVFEERQDEAGGSNHAVFSGDCWSSIGLLVYVSPCTCCGQQGIALRTRRESSCHSSLNIVWFVCYGKILPVLIKVSQTLINLALMSIAIAENIDSADICICEPLDSPAFH